MTRETIAEVNAFLAAFAMLNDSCNHCCSYSLDPVPRNGTVDQSLMAHFEGIKNYDADGCIRSEGGWRLSVAEVDDWRRELRRLLSKWLFGEHFPQFTVGQEFAKDNGCDWLMFKIDALLAGRLTIGWALEVDSDNVFYDLVFDDFALESDGRIYLMHFGFRD